MFIYDKNAYEKIISVFCKNTHIHVKNYYQGTNSNNIFLLSLVYIGIDGHTAQTQKIN